MNLIGKKALKASREKINSKLKNKVLEKYIYLINKNRKLIIKKNNLDINLATRKKIKKNLLERLKIDHKKIDGICFAIKNVKNLKDPINITLAKWRRPNKLIIKRVTVPIGVIAVIFETGIHLLRVGSVARGYVLVAVLPSIAHVMLIELSASLTLSPAINP